MKQSKSLKDFSVGELRAELARRETAQLGFSLSDIETGIEEIAAAHKQEMLEVRLEQLGPEKNTSKPCPKCGRRVRIRSRNVSRTLRTLSGELSYRRHYHYCERCSFGFYPRDRELGVPEQGELSYELEKRVLDFAINDTFEEASQRFSLHYGWSISDNLVRRVTDRVGKRIETSDETYVQHALSVPAQQSSKLILVQNDGSMLPTRAGWKEAKMAVVTRAEHHVSNRELKRGMVSQARYVAVLGEQKEFEQALYKTLRVEKAHKANQIVWLADGAIGNWRLAHELAPGSIQILDWYHAIEHATDCGKILFLENDACILLWKKRCECLLIRGDVSQVLTELEDCVLLSTDHQELEALNALLRYYRNNQKRMRYAEYLEKGYPLGNGAAESSHRHVLQVRMKRAGQRWSLPRARRMAKLRAAYRTCGPKKLHHAIRVAAEATRVAALPKHKKFRAKNR